MQRLHRINPTMPVQNYKTYQMAMPKVSHTRPATCVEVECPHHQNGWACTVVSGSRDEDIIRNSGRHFLPPEVQEGGFIRFVFPPGQPCFKADTHRVSLERPPLYVVKGGDWRGNPTGQRRVHANGDDWVDDFANHQDKLADTLGRG